MTEANRQSEEKEEQIIEIEIERLRPFKEHPFQVKDDKENTDNIRKSIRKQVPERILRNTNIFHLRGGIDYDKLNFKHRTMMNLLYHKVKKIPKEKMTAETKAMIETYGTKVDFVDYQSLNQIMEAITM